MICKIEIGNLWNRNLVVICKILESVYDFGIPVKCIFWGPVYCHMFDLCS